MYLGLLGQKKKQPNYDKTKSLSNDGEISRTNNEQLIRLGVEYNSYSSSSSQQ